MSLRLAYWLLIGLGFTLGATWLWAVFWQLEFSYTYGIEAIGPAGVAIGWLPIIKKPAIW
ncbi:MAG TPA: hypothetical protein DE179_05230 [Oceanospirillaceae bacterium]|nr:hypothetical protein [Oceanospirillaceae bacterium]